MKVGILTYHCVPNFGAQLQTLSTFCYLRNIGHDPVVLNWYPKDLEDIYKHIPLEQISAHNEYCDKFYTMSSLCRTESDLVKEIDSLNLDAIILGSDALFKYVPLRKRWYFKMGKYKPRMVFVKVPIVEKLCANPFFGGFIDGLNKRIPVSVYAVSAQNTQFLKMIRREKKLMKSFLSNFKMISVRDIWTKQMVESVMEISNVNIYPDPVFAFNQNVANLIPTKETILDKFNIKGKYILLSFRTHHCSDEYIQSIAEEIRKEGFVPISLTMPEGVRCDALENVITTPLSPMDWYALIKYSSGYIGERMHPIIVSLHNSVPCFVFDEYGCQDTAKIILPRPIKYTVDSSKIYHIMKEADLLECWHSYLMNKYLPTPKEVMQKILKCSNDKCTKFSKIQHTKYLDGMSSILESIVNS